MNTSRTRRLTAGAVVVTMVAGLMALVVLQPASANHGTFRLEVSREIDSAPTGGKIILTANLVQSNGARALPGAGGGVNIDFEVEGGTADTEAGLNTPATPDYSCTTTAAPEADPAKFETASCTVEIVNPSSTGGASLVRAWIDHDGSNLTVEADDTEARLSGPATDCTTELPPPAGTGDTDMFDACTSDSDGAANAGRTAERDNTDVVRVTFSAAILRLNCEPELTKGPRENDIVVVCTVTDDSGAPRSGVLVDAVHLTGANDPNGGGPSSPGAADYNDGPPSDANGKVAVTVSTTSDPGFQTGPAEICAWIDGDSADDNDSEVPNDPLYDPSYDAGSTANDGGACDIEVLADEPVAAANDPDGVAKNRTDRFQVEWQRRVPTSLDAEPEGPASSTVGGTHTVTATALDQFGAPFPDENTVVSGEFFSGSPKDSDGNDPTPPDLGTCNTNGGTDDQDKSTCTFTYTSASSPGTDVMCFWIGTDPEMAGSGTAAATCDRETNIIVTGATDVGRVDVVSKRWTAAGTTNTTTTTTTRPNDTTTVTTTPGDQGYTLVGTDGGIFTYGTSKFHGSTGDLKLNEPVVGMANKKGATGYWLVAKDGGIFSFGDAEFFGSTGDIKLNAPILGMEATPSGRGYYLFAADGGIFTFGDAVFHGSTGDRKLNAPAVGLAVNEKGDGYWLVAQDGGIFSFGRVPFHGSTGDRKLNEPVFDMAPTAGDNGYWLVAKDGGVFSFGDAENKFYGSAVGATTAPVIGMGATPSFNGYWIADSQGAVFHFGDALFLGDRRNQAENAATVGFATVPKK